LFFEAFVARGRVLVVFRANLERVCASRGQLAAHIRVTVLHETAHFFGYSESQLRSMGLA
jgi:predicted Zn-dependent protease with MMP-like domain